MQEDKPNESFVDPESDFKSIKERSANGYKQREDKYKNKIPFGISFLDDALGGITQDELTLIGAKTGMGKTQLATLIAINAAKSGKRVHYFALEAYEGEIEDRIVYPIIKDEAYRRNPQREKVDYLKWLYCEAGSDLEEIENTVRQKDLYPTFKVFYRKNEFGIKDFERLFLLVKDKTDLIIIDHLHYFDIDGPNENAELKQIIKDIRDCGQISGKPVVLVAHLRKTDRRLKQLIPDIEDFHGSSDIAKIGTTAITVAPDPECNEKNFKKTYMKIMKFRKSSARCIGVAKMAFSFRDQAYDETYAMGYVNQAGDKFTEMTNDKIPDWAKRAAREVVKPSGGDKEWLK